LFKIKETIYKFFKYTRKDYNLLVDLPCDIIISSIIPLIFFIFLFHKDICQFIQRPINQNIKAKQDCETFVRAIQKYNTLENNKVIDKYFKEIRGKYIQGLDTFKDPWGTRYMQDPIKHIVYSAGPDKTEGTNDDIIVNY